LDSEFLFIITSQLIAIYKLNVLILEITKERGSIGLGGAENATSMSNSIVDQLNYVNTAKHIM
jgi:hypothetical protein